MTYIYNEIIQKNGIEKAIDCGFFDTPEFSYIDNTKNFTYSFTGEINITKNTLIKYFPGAFTYLHEGHMLSIIKAYRDALAITDDFYIVISPANSDYLNTKYPNTENIKNKKRFDRIIQLINEYDYLFYNDGERKLSEHILIDLNPMLNTTQDYNFTDLLKGFLSFYDNINNFIHKPIILAGGKDRLYFKDIEKYTDKIGVECYENKFCNKVSSKDYLKDTLEETVKKHCIFRCEKVSQYNLFNKILGKYYLSITPSYLKDELKIVNYYKKVFPNSSFLTICKEYKNEMLYHKFGRKRETPLSDSFHDFSDIKKIPHVDFIIDSDSYSGQTIRNIEYVHHNTKVLPILKVPNINNYEIVDLCDIIDNYFIYPYYDISERMSLPAFTTEMYHEFNLLKKEMRNL